MTEEERYNYLLQEINNYCEHIKEDLRLVREQMDDLDEKKKLLLTHFEQIRNILERHQQRKERVE